MAETGVGSARLSAHARAGEATWAKVAAARETSPDTRTVAAKAKASTKAVTKPAKVDKAAKAAAKAPAAKAAKAKPLPTLTILETRVLRGPNYWSRQPIVKMLVDLGVLEKFPSDKIP